MSFHDVPLESVYTQVKSNSKGLSSSEAEKRLSLYGKNKLREIKRTSLWVLFLNQFNDFLIWILFGAALFSGIIGEWTDVAVISIILLLNACLGFFQEYRAEEAISKLQKMTSPHAVVLRDGESHEIPATDIVIGDVLILTAGTKISADLRLIEAHNLEVNESSLTGESNAVNKKVGTSASDAVLGDRINMGFTGTTVTNGRGQGVVVATSMDTELGKIAGLISVTPRVETPLKKHLTVFSKFLGIGVMGICLLMFLIGTLRGETFILMFLTAVSLAVAAVPEGLPAVVTITLSLGLQRMAKRNALIRHLPAVETLGSTTVICSDKTGTLTHGKMTVEKIYVDNKIIEVSGDGYIPQGEFSSTSPSLLKLLTIGALCNDAQLLKRNSHYESIGDPTEVALVVSAAKAKIEHTSLTSVFPRCDEIPFTSERKMMSTIHKNDDEYLQCTKGSVDVLLPLCSHHLVDGKVRTLSSQDKEQILSQNESFAQESLRVLGFAYRDLTHDKGHEDQLIFVGLQAMMDPPRDEAIAAIQTCKDAHIRVVMITGDHKVTATAIAAKMGIGSRVITGQELDQVVDFDSLVDRIDIYARVNPEHKLKIVEAFQRKGEIVAMTGDGVNDAPALKKADIGVAMGIAGTDVSKEAAEMVLADDNFASLVNAVKEGRTIYDNICKFIEFLLSCNLGEVLVVFLAILLGFPLPLVAVMILWMNLLTDGLPALALGLNPAEHDIMKLKPRKKDHRLIGRYGVIRMVSLSVLMSIGTFGFFFYGLETSIEYARTLAFCGLVFFQLWNVLNYRSLYGVFNRGLFVNKHLVLAIASSFALQLIVIFILGDFFGVVALSFMELLMLLGVSSSAFIIVELAKLFGLWSPRHS